MVESIVILCDKGPFGTNTANEAIRLGSGFIALGEDVDCKLILMGDGVIFMNKNLQPDLLGMDSVDEGIEMADLSELPILLVKEDLDERGLTENDLVEYEAIEIISKSDIPKIIEEYDTAFKI